MEIKGEIRMNIIVSNLNYIALVFALLLSGCYQSVNKYDMDRAVKACGGYEEVIHINASFVGVETVQCSNSEHSTLNSVSTK